MGCIIVIVLPAVGKGSWIALTAGIKGEVVEDICSIEGGPGEPWDFLFRLEKTEDRELKCIDIRG